MAVANFHYITQMNSGFKVYILEGQPNLRSGDRFRSLSNHRAAPSPIYPIKRKYSPERSHAGETLGERLAKMRRFPVALVIEKRDSGESPKGARQEKSPVQWQVASSTSNPEEHAHTPSPCSPDQSPNSSSPCSPEGLNLTLQHSPVQSLTLVPLHSPQQNINMASRRSPVDHLTSLSPRSPTEHVTLPLSRDRAHASGMSPDEPLALIKKPTEASKSNSSPLSTAQLNTLQQMRPSVIMCVSSSHRACGRSSPCPLTCCHSGCPTPAYRPETKALPLITPCNPVVEEHFRRSLCRNFGDPEPSPCVSISGSVDDHFAKALGDKWLQIKVASDSALLEASPRGAKSPWSSPGGPRHSQSPSLLR
ncbi:transcription cofactor vestigial-like protein 4 [Latimeria chalumnae]|uniref:transcription cofactor vestigial-like protein 4 n=1 Tax=Latimeria chalumnae TaxID=7897 RepID=UPI0003C1251A|nr:PREDICTED: transcription cofactor vestigial-like protein 4 [Latimeria chalumnae]|eukprot:XP_006004034.1 PREDICTED: transcription cofactor vestigial-like protein 4 [Latimeria chalumnae]